MTLEVAKIAILAVGVPLAVFSVNWIYRSEKGYPQTAAADFLLGVFIFDGSVILASGDFAPFLRTEHLREFIGYWHFGAAFCAGLLWASIIRWAEPAFANYYGRLVRGRFPIGAFLGCWISVLIVVASHVCFFAFKA